MSVEYVGLHRFDRGFGQRRIDEMRHTIVVTHLADGIDLILHQSDERRDDDGHPFHEKRRQLVAKRFAAACRHQHKHIVPRKQAANDGFLIVLETLKAKVLLEWLAQIYFSRHGRWT